VPIVRVVERAALAVVREATVEIVVPVYNEERDLEPSVRRLRTYLDARFPFHATVTIADNASVDGTQPIGRRLAATVPGVRYVRISEKGRGRALAATWLISDADVVAYMDIDLSTDLDALLPLVAPLISGHSDLAIGSRLVRGAKVRRGWKRELVSRAYNAVLRIALGARFNDARCGFKAIRADLARRLVPQVADRNWFFDTELLVLAQRAGMRIYEVPVDWDDDPDSKAELLHTALDDLAGVWRLMRPARGDAPLQVVPADGPEVVEDANAEGDDRGDGEIDAQLVTEIGQPAGERHVGDQAAVEHAWLERAGDIRLERTEYRVERRKQRDRRVARVGDRNRDRRKHAKDHPENREKDRDDDYLHGFGAGVATGDGDGEGAGDGGGVWRGL
jgi:hypothetical protein